jgi:hypothetical protein
LITLSAMLGPLDEVGNVVTDLSMRENSTSGDF